MSQQNDAIATYLNSLCQNKNYATSAIIAFETFPSGEIQAVYVEQDFLRFTAAINMQILYPKVKVGESPNSLINCLQPHYVGPGRTGPFFIFFLRKNLLLIR